LRVSSNPISALVGPNLLEDSWSIAQLRSKTRILPLKFYAQPTVDVARALLGCVLVHGNAAAGGEVTAGMIVETEAYLPTDSRGQPDRAAHSYAGQTPRTAVIFGPPGRAYVYFIYGMHECLNVVVEPNGVPGCVLIRALEPLVGLDLMAERRAIRHPSTSLTNGPGKLTQAMGITRDDYGARLDRGALTIRQWKARPAFEIEVTPRIGIKHCAEWPLRFLWKDNAFVSR
jgi:DNA-3-methyladenine glycosylase